MAPRLFTVSRSRTSWDARPALRKIISVATRFKSSAMRRGASSSRPAIRERRGPARSRRPARKRARKRRRGFASPSRPPSATVKEMSSEEPCALKRISAAISSSPRSPPSSTVKQKFRRQGAQRRLAREPFAQGLDDRPSHRKPPWDRGRQSGDIMTSRTDLGLMRRRDTVEPRQRFDQAGHRRLRSSRAIEDCRDSSDRRGRCRSASRKTRWRASRAGGTLPTGRAQAHEQTVAARHRPRHARAPSSTQFGRRVHVRAPFFTRSAARAGFGADVCFNFRIRRRDRRVGNVRGLHHLGEVPGGRIAPRRPRSRDARPPRKRDAMARAASGLALKQEVAHVLVAAGRVVEKVELPARHGLASKPRRRKDCRPSRRSRRRRDSRGASAPRSSADWRRGRAPRARSLPRACARRFARARGVGVIERRIGTERRGGGRKAALMLGEGVGIEHVLTFHVLHMDEGIGRATRVRKALAASIPSENEPAP